jgi:hypothetical protein
VKIHWNLDQEFFEREFKIKKSEARDSGFLKTFTNSSNSGSQSLTIGAQVEEREDGLIIDGSGGEPLEGGATVTSALDHRIAMSFAVAGQNCYHAVTVDDVSPIATSFPTFEDILINLQAQH